MTTLAEMTVDQAASKGLEVILRGWYEGSANSSWGKGAGESFEQWLNSSYGRDSYSRVDMQVDNLNAHEHVWKEVKYEAGEGTEYVHDGFTTKVVAEYGGEGQGDQFWVVISVSDGETVRFFRRDGWYSSYGDGGNLDGPTSEVRPQEKTVVLYE